MPEARRALILIVIAAGNIITRAPMRVAIVVVAIASIVVGRAAVVGVVLVSLAWPRRVVMIRTAPAALCGRGRGDDRKRHGERNRHGSQHGDLAPLEKLSACVISVP